MIKHDLGISVRLNFSKLHHLLRLCKKLYLEDDKETIKYYNKQGVKMNHNNIMGSKFHAYQLVGNLLVDNHIVPWIRELENLEDAYTFDINIPNYPISVDTICHSNYTECKFFISAYIDYNVDISTNPNPIKTLANNNNVVKFREWVDRNFKKIYTIKKTPAIKDITGCYLYDPTYDMMTKVIDIGIRYDDTSCTY